jgi:hypothetical protein
MVSKVESFCKILPIPKDSSNIYFSAGSIRNDVNVHQNRIISPDGRNVWDFDRVFSNDPKNMNELYALTCGNLTKLFLNGFNAALLLIGTPECVNTLCLDGKGPLAYLTEHLSSVATKVMKNKQSSQTSVQSSAAGLDGTSLPFLKVKNDVEMKIYAVENGEIFDLSTGNTRISSLGIRSCELHFIKRDIHFAKSFELKKSSWPLFDY